LERLQAAEAALDRLQVEEPRDASFDRESQSSSEWSKPRSSSERSSSELDTEVNEEFRPETDGDFDGKPRSSSEWSKPRSSIDVQTEGNEEPRPETSGGGTAAWRDPNDPDGI